MPKPNKKELEFLRKTAEIESSGGANLSHRELASGLHKGEAAQGRYGLMPNTIDEIRNRMIRADIKVPGVQLKELSKDKLVELVRKDRGIEDAFATHLLRTIKSKGVDDETASYMWEYGHNKIPDAKKVDEAPRTKKFNALENTAKEMLKKQQERRKQEQEQELKLENPKLRPGPLAALRPVAQAIKDYIPGISDVAGGVESVTGKDLITGEDKSQLERGIGAGGAMLAAFPFGIMAKPAAALATTADEALDVYKLLKTYKPAQTAERVLEKLPEQTVGAFADEFIKDTVSKTSQSVPKVAAKLVNDAGLAPPKSDSLSDLGKYYSDVLRERKNALQSVSDIPA